MCSLCPFHDSDKEVKMGEKGHNSALVTQCLEFCQTLASMGQTFNFSLSVGPNFTISLDTRNTSLDPKKADVKNVKKISPSARRRNKRRREDFLKRKASASDSKEESSEKENEPAIVSNSMKCDQCEKIFNTENGLKIHKGKNHKSLEGEKPETLRDSYLQVLESHKCDQCTAKFSCEDELVQHAEAQHLPSLRCHVCGDGPFWDHRSRLQHFHDKHRNA